MSSLMEEQMNDLRNFLFASVYKRSDAVTDEEGIKKLIRRFYDYYMENHHLLPEHLQQFPKEMAVCDYIAGMTDRYAIRVYSDIHIPKKFRGFTTTAPEID